MTLRFWNRRTAVEAEQVGVSDVAQVFDSDLTGEKAVGGHLAEKCEELHALAQAGIALSVLHIRDRVENFLLLLRSAVEIGLPISISAHSIQPHQAAAKFQLIVRILAGKKVDELRRSGLDGAPGFS